MQEQVKTEADLPVRWTSLPFVQVFIALTVILLPVVFILVSALVVGDLWVFVQVFVALAVIPPFVTLLWLATGCGALCEWLHARRARTGHETS